MTCHIGSLVFRGGPGSHRLSFAEADVLFIYYVCLQFPKRPFSDCKISTNQHLMVAAYFLHADRTESNEHWAADLWEADLRHQCNKRRVVVSHDLVY